MSGAASPTGVTVTVTGRRRRSATAPATAAAASKAAAPTATHGHAEAPPSVAAAGGRARGLGDCGGATGCGLFETTNSGAADELWAPPEPAPAYVSFTFAT